VLVVCGAGGVGKTTTSAALALTAASLGRRVLVLTIDPARRLAQALGLPAGAPLPTPVPAGRLAAAGLAPDCRLDAWMLDPQVVLENLVARLAPPAAAQTIRETRVYQYLLRLVAGMQEYTAAEALFQLAEDGAYDLLVLDTPPTRGALDFLDAPGRLLQLLDDGLLQQLLPRRGGLLRRAVRLAGSLFSRLFGDAFFGDLQAFARAFGGLFAAVHGHAGGVKALLTSERAGFLLVTSPQAMALDEALAFRGELQARALPFRGFVLNRSDALLRDLSGMPLAGAAPDRDPIAAAALGKLARLAARERAAARSDAALFDRLVALAGPTAFAVAAPNLGDAVEDLPGLLQLGRALLEPAKEENG
jgi:anion-transporting  ArsA/GET3 family ATPase